MRKLNGLIIYCDTGGGFKAPAIAIQKEIKDRGHSVDLVDVPKKFSPLSNKMFQVMWRLILKYPNTYEKIYAFADRKGLKSINFSSMFSGIKIKLLNYIKKNDYDFILSIHFLTTKHIGQLREEGKITVPTFAYNADVLEAHMLWVENGVDYYFAPSKRCYNIMLKKGLKKEKLILSSFPINKEFLKKSNKNKILKKLNLEKKFTILFMVGGEGDNIVFDYVPSLAKMFKDIQLIVVCGKNKKIKENLEKKNIPNLKVLGFVDNMHELYHISDMAIIKSGYNTVFECIYTKTPAVVVKAVVSERFGARYLVENGVGWWPKNKTKGLELIKEIIENKSILKDAEKNFKKISYKPGAKFMADFIEKKTKFKNRKNWLLFDLGDTLINIDIHDKWDKVNQDGIMDVLKFLNVPGSKERLEKLANKFVSEKNKFRNKAKKTLREFSLKKQLKEFLKKEKLANVTDEELEYLEELFIKPELKITKNLKNNFSVIKNLSKRYNLAIISNNVSKKFVESCLKKAKIKDYFDEVIVSEDVGYRKPHKKFMQHVLKHLNVDADKCVIIGDRLNDDILIASRSNVTSIRITEKNHPDNVGVKNIKPDFEVRSLKELEELLNS